MYSKKIEKFHQRVETNIFISAIIGRKESSITKRNSVKAITLQYVTFQLALSHNALYGGEQLFLLIVFTLGR